MAAAASAKVWRWLLAGPGAAVASLVVFAASPLWLPRGAASIDHLVIPGVALPGVWAIVFFHAVLDRRLARVALVFLGIVLVNAALLLRHFGYLH